MSKEIEYKVNKKGKEYVGIELKKNKLTIRLPIGYHYNEKERQKPQFKSEIRKMLTTLSKKTKISGEEECTKREDMNFDFLSSLKVVNDYKNYGLYKQMELKTKMNDKGKINWTKTINKEQIYLENQIFFINIVNQYMDYKCEKEIQEIQEFCLYEISNYLGHLLEFSYPKKQKRFEKNEMLNILNRELRNTNEDIKIKMLSHLLTFIKNTSIRAIRDGHIAIKYKEFEYIYQNLVDEFGMSHSEKSKYNPRAKYEYWEAIGNKKEYKIPSASYPDTIIKDMEPYKNMVFILDAKYKKIDTLPNEYDIFKQIRYAIYLENKLKEENNQKYHIMNAFILPKDLPKDIVQIENYYARSEDLKNKIYVIYVDNKSIILDAKNTMKRALELLVKTDKMIQIIEKKENRESVCKKLEEYIEEAAKDSIWGEKMIDKLENFIEKAYPSLKNIRYNKRRNRK